MCCPPSLELNQVLRALPVPVPEHERLYPHLHLVPMPLGLVLYE